MTLVKNTSKSHKNGNTLKLKRGKKVASNGRVKPERSPEGFTRRVGSGRADEAVRHPLLVPARGSTHYHTG